MNDPDPLGDALLALRCLAVAPKQIGGVWLRGGAGPLRERLLAQLRAWLPDELPLRTMPPSIDSGRLEGGVDVAASLAAGRSVLRAGLLAECWSGVLLVQGAGRLRPALAARLSQARDDGGPALILLDDGAEEERPGSCLTDRVGPIVDLTACRELPAVSLPETASALPSLDGAHQEALAMLALRLGVHSARALLAAACTAEAAASVSQREQVEDADLIAAARLVLAPRATRLPEDAPPPPPQPDTQETEAREQAIALEDVVLDAIRRRLLPELIGALASGKAPSRSAGAHGHGSRTRSRSHGRPLGTRSGVPAGGLRLALIDTLRAAAPWQAARGRGEGRVLLRRGDLKIRRFEDRQTVLSIFVVDASGSAAFARLAEAKGAVELLLERAYARRAEVALIAFRGTAAELLLPPTRSLTRARRLLGDLPGGGGTPLATGLDEARLMAEGARAKGRTVQLVVLTDGRANVTRTGAQDRATASADAEAAGRSIAAAGVSAIVIDISARAQSEAARLAAAMNARLVHLPHADAGTLAAAAA